MPARPNTILAVATLTQAFAIGVTVGVFPLFLEPIEKLFDAPRTVVALGPILVMTALAAAGVVAGGVLDRGRVRSAMNFGALLMSASLWMASVAPSLSVLALAALGAGFSIPFLGPLAGMTLVTRTFAEDQGRAFGIMSMGPGIGSGLFAGLAGLLLQRFDWQTIYQILALTTLVVLVPIISRIVPTQLDALETDAREATSAVTLGEVLRRQVFWLSAMVFALSAGIATGWTSHVGAYLAGMGLTESQVALVVAIQFWIGVPGALAFGIGSDRLPLTPLYIAMLIFEGVAFLIYASGVSFLAAASLGLALGFVIGGLIPLYMALIGQRLEPQILGRAMGISNLVMLPLMAFSTLLAAWSFESSGGYEKALVVFALSMIVAIATLLLSNRHVSSPSAATEEVGAEI